MKDTFVILFCTTPMYPSFNKYIYKKKESRFSVVCSSLEKNTDVCARTHIPCLIGCREGDCGGCGNSPDTHTHIHLISVPGGVLYGL